LAGRSRERSGLERCGKNGAESGMPGNIKEVWTDMRPLSLRKKMQEAEEKQKDSPASAEEGDRGKFPF